MQVAVHERGGRWRSQAHRVALPRSILPTGFYSDGIGVAPFLPDGTEEGRPAVEDLEKLKEIREALRELAAEVVRLAERIEQIKIQLETIVPPAANGEQRCHAPKPSIRFFVPTPGLVAGFGRALLAPEPAVVTGFVEPAMLPSAIPGRRGLISSLGGSRLAWP
jgi:hypothetical protein